MGKEGAKSVQAVAMGHNKSQLQKGVDQIIGVDAKIQALKGDRMNIFNRLDEQGYDRKEVAEIVKLKQKPKELSKKLGVNNLCTILDMPEEYALNKAQMKIAQQEAGGGEASGEADDSEEQQEAVH